MQHQETGDWVRFGFTYGLFVTFIPETSSVFLQKESTAYTELAYVARSITQDGTFLRRRKCLDYLIPLNQRHLRRILAGCVAHYNDARPHSRLGPGIPDPSSVVAGRLPAHEIPRAHRVTATPILGGLRHEYRLTAVAG